MEPAALTDPMAFLKSLWGKLPAPLPGFAPSVDPAELEKRINDLKAVEGWLQANAQMVRMTVQNLEVQKATLAVLGAAITGLGNDQGKAQPQAASTSDPPLWPTQFLQSANALFAAATAVPNSTEAGRQSAAPAARKARKQSSAR